MNKSKSSIRRRGQGPKIIANHFRTGDRRLQSIQQQANATRVLKAALWPAIPTQLQAHCDLAVFREPTLVFVAYSPVWAARLRHTSPQILHAARRLCKINAQELVVKIQPNSDRSPRSGRLRVLPERSASHLREVASGVEDEELKEILLAIANRNR